MSEADRTEIVSDTFATEHKGSKIELSNNGQTAKLTGMYGENGWGTVRGSKLMSSGAIYRTDVTIDNLAFGSRIRIGVCLSTSGKDATSAIGWYWDTKSASIFSPNTSSTNYGETCKTGDEITIIVDLIDYKISFCKNEKDLGVAFSNFSKSSTWNFLVCIDNQQGSQVTLN
ncbi:heterogeneous nuclear ribonucleoprotein u family member [Anaeramoeba flamelloides]|uniref:Heterogeneous nuclear ribonucleoprotein u family member n=1 Tax=Anaeramoeba flamelloides TaxID=1746091 RepID=A0AAV7ZKR0_9EUKA|nr:heterogeneous nuclear ribonucleoprotein u family member [Anaeramoeba flamelloides]KAJ6235439.1 heterogeneous nuclear ribonucleoprotein u family member [Anaeramoeba flamelloides]